MLEKLIDTIIRKVGLSTLASIVISVNGCNNYERIMGNGKDFPETSFEKMQGYEDALSVYDGGEACPYFVSFSYRGESPNGNITHFEYRLDSNEKVGTWRILDDPGLHTDEFGNWVDNIYHDGLCLDAESNGNYVLLIRAVDDKGLKDPTPAKYEFTLED